MINFFYYLYYRLKQANSQPSAHQSEGTSAAYISIVLLLIINCLSVYFLAIGFLNQKFAHRIWTEDKIFNQVVSFLIILLVPAGVYGWYKKHLNRIEQTLLHYRNENSDERRVSGVLIMGYIFASCLLLILSLLSPVLF